MKKWLLLCTVLCATMAHAERQQIMLYDAWGSADRVEIDGRVIERESSSQSKESDAWWRNLLRNVRIIKNSDREGVAFALKIGENDVRAASGAEGYFQISSTLAKPLTAGWHVTAAQGLQQADTGEGRLLMIPTRNTFGVISDIDDTVVVSEVLDKSKLIANTFLNNPLQRKTFPGTAGFYKKLLAQNPELGAAPMFYLSASPRQLAENIAEFLAHNDFPKGVVITKQVNGDNRDPLLDQQKYKIGKIEKIFKSLPWVRFTLVGDDGERDPETYHEIQQRYPARVVAVYIRKVNPDRARAVYPGQLDLAAAAQK
jgi:phosphatidate phosphatase APP1